MVDKSLSGKVALITGGGQGVGQGIGLALAARGADMRLLRAGVDGSCEIYWALQGRAAASNNQAKSRPSERRAATPSQSSRQKAHKPPCGDKGRGLAPLSLA